MLMLIPILTFLAFFLVSWGRAGGAAQRPADWRGDFLLAAAFWGASVTLISEFLTLFSALNQLWLAILWAIVLGAALLVGWRSGNLARAWIKVQGFAFPKEWADRLLLSALGIVVVALFVVAWVSPPNNVDSFIYHMTRVEHWAQDVSLRHYPAGSDQQLLKPIWAETAILNLRVLWGSDKPANLVQWFSMLGSVVGVAGLAGLLGAGRKGQLLAAAITISIPMGILQATSTQNDYVAAFWAVTLGYLVVLSKKQDLTKMEFTALCLATGLGMLTKATFFVYAPPLIVWYFLPRMRPGRIRRLIAEAVSLGLAVVVLNLAFWARNVGTYGGPYGPWEWVKYRYGLGIPLPMQFLNRLLPPTANPTDTQASPTVPAPTATLVPTVTVTPPPEPSPQPSPTIAAPPVGLPASPTGNGLGDRILRGLGQRISNLAKTATWNLMTPFHRVNRQLLRLAAKFPAMFDSDYPTWVDANAWTHEDTAGNPVHLLLVPVGLVGIASAWRRLNRKLVVKYALMTLLMYALLPIVAGGSTYIWGLRYQLPFFVLWAPLAGVAVAALVRERVTAFLAGGFVLLAIPWVLLNSTRPILTSPRWGTRIVSIFKASPSEILFANYPDLRHGYESTANLIMESGCREVGVRMTEAGPEYPLWWLLDAPQSGIEITSRYHSDQTERYVDRSIQPCAIVCADCGANFEMPGFRLAGSFAPLNVYLRDDQAHAR